jgi:membrane protein implicated in regulation of membrane protease activity
VTEAFTAIGPAWAWIIGGLLVAACELLAPGAFLIWVGLAAIATGAILAVLTLPWEVQLILFGVLAGVGVLVGRRLARNPPTGLNRRGHSLVGQEFTLDSPVAQGVGRLRLGDTSWRIVGPDMPAGARVRVIALDGVTLEVAPANHAEDMAPVSLAAPP